MCWLSGKLASEDCPHRVKELMITGTAEPEVCDLHHDKDFHYYLEPPMPMVGPQRDGTGREQISFGLSGSSSPAADSGDIERSVSKSSRIEIVSPHNLDRFVLTSHNSGRVLFRAVPNPVVSHVVWMLDGMQVASHPATVRIRFGK